MNGAGALLALLAAAVVVAGGLAAVARGVWKAAQDVRDNKNATQANTRALGDLRVLMETRIGGLEQRLYAVETYLSRGTLRR